MVGHELDIEAMYLSTEGPLPREWAQPAVNALAMSISAMGSHEASVVQVSGGRKLAFQIFGDPTGRPVFFFHGSPACRLEAAFLDEAAARRQLRLIGIDRPGMGDSDPQPGRRLRDWPADVDAVAKVLELERFSLMGFSTGALYVYACAQAMPHRIDAAVLVSGPERQISCVDSIPAGSH